MRVRAELDRIVHPGSHVLRPGPRGGRGGRRRRGHDRPGLRRRAAGDAARPRRARRRGGPGRLPRHPHRPGPGARRRHRARRPPPGERDGRRGRRQRDDRRPHARLDHREVSLGTGVYLAPERWHGEAPGAPADVYAATVTLFESLAGEPPYWEESQLLALRYQHEQGEIPQGIAVELREIIRGGMAKEAEFRADADALLAVVDVTAIAEYGPDWADTGRAALDSSRVGACKLAFGPVDAIGEPALVRGRRAGRAGRLLRLEEV